MRVWYRGVPKKSCVFHAWKKRGKYHTDIAEAEEKCMKHVDDLLHEERLAEKEEMRRKIMEEANG